MLADRRRSPSAPGSLLAYCARSDDAAAAPAGLAAARRRPGSRSLVAAPLAYYAATGFQGELDQRPAPLRRRPGQLRAADELRLGRRLGLRAHLEPLPRRRRRVGRLPRDPDARDPRLVRVSARRSRVGAVPARGAPAGVVVAARDRPRGEGARSRRGSRGAPSRACRSSTTSSRPASPRTSRSAPRSSWRSGRRRGTAGCAGLLRRWPSRRSCPTSRTTGTRSCPSGGRSSRAAPTSSACRRTRTSRSSRSASAATRPSGRRRPGFWFRMPEGYLAPRPPAKNIDSDPVIRMLTYTYANPTPGGARRVRPQQEGRPDRLGRHRTRTRTATEMHRFGPVQESGGVLISPACGYPSMQKGIHPTRPHPGG